MELDSPIRLVRYLEERFPGCYSALDALRHGRVWPGISDVTGMLMGRYGLDLMAAAYYAPAVCACGIWICYKRIYNFQEPLARSLCGDGTASLPPDLKSDPLRYLPLPSIFIQSGDAICPGILGFFVWLREGGSDGDTLQLLFLHTSGFIPGSIRLEANTTLEHSFPDAEQFLYPMLVAAARGEEGALQVMLQKLNVPGPYPNVIHNLTVRSAQLLLYLVSSNPDLGQVDGDTVAVGRKVSSALQPSASRSSHIRQGHWHNYWCGPKNGERRLVPKWIPPVIVGEGRSLTPEVKVLKIK